MEGVVLDRVGILGLFSVLNRVRVSNPQWHPHTKTWVKCPPPLPQGQQGHEKVLQISISQMIMQTDHHPKYYYI